MKILVLNSGSSSQKACLYDFNEPLSDHPAQPLWEGKLEWRDDDAALQVHTSRGLSYQENIPPADRSAATAHLLNELVSGKASVLQSISEIAVAGHRIVNGGRRPPPPPPPPHHKNTR